MTAQALRDAGYRVADSEANFVMADVRRDIRVFQRACRNRGVEIARPFPPLLTWARITIGTMAEMQQAVEAFRGALTEPVPTAEALPALERYVAAPRWHLGLLTRRPGCAAPASTRG